MSIDLPTASLAARIKAAVELRFGDNLAGVYLFGSRARGDQRPDSDVDLAVVLHNPGRSLSALDQELLDLTYPMEIESGLHIQAWTLSAELGGVRSKLAAIVRREGIQL